MRDELAATTESLTYGDVTDFGNFGGAVIDDRAFDRLSAAIDRAHGLDTATVLAGGSYDDSVGYFVRPTVVECADPSDELFHREYFGPLLSVHVYDDADWDDTLVQLESASRYALTGAVFARDRHAIDDGLAGAALRRRQLLRQRQADRRGRRPAAVRRRARVGDQRQGRVAVEPDAVAVAARDQGDVRAPTDHRYPHMG